MSTNEDGKHGRKEVTVSRANRTGRISKIAAAVMILLAVFILLSDLDEFSTYKAYVNGKSKDIYDEDFDVKLSKEYVSLAGTQTVKQAFTAKSSTISSIGLSYFCVRNDELSGELSVSIADETGEELAGADIDITTLTKKKIQEVSFGDSGGDVCKVTKGGTYYIVVSSRDIRTEEGFGLYKQKDGDEIYSAVIYSQLKKKVLLLYIILILIAAEIVLYASVRKKNRGQADPETGAGRLSVSDIVLRLMFIATPLMGTLLGYKITGMSFRECGMSLLSFRGIVNLAVCGAVWWLVYLLSNRKKITIITATLLNLIFLLLNFGLIQFRGAPLMFNDAAEWKTAAMVAGNYKLSPDQHALCVIILSLLWMAVALVFKEEKHLPLKARFAVLLIAAVWCGGVYNLVWTGDTLAKHGINLSPWDPLNSYTKNGYYLSFLMSAKQSVIEKPDGYSVEAVEAIAAKYESDTADKVTKTTEKTPNIIVIMNEAFSDMEMYGEIATDEEVIPFFKSLKKNVIRGTMHSSVYGGHTAVSEFEVLTGNSQRFMPINSVAYSGFITSEMPSLAWDLKSRGYGGITAFHPGYATSYNRDKVYPLLGFDKHVSSESMVDPDRIRNLISDKADYERLIAEYEEYRAEGAKVPYFMFNVTIQNHGSYTFERGEVEPTQVKITDSELQFEELGQFLNLMKISDQEFEKLIDYFSNVDEPTVILMYGDHQPKVESEFYEKMFARTEGLSEAEKQDMKYRVPFIIWANYDIEEQTDVDISANYLQQFLLSSIGAPMTGYDKYLAELHKSLPVISDSTTIDSEGNVYSSGDETPYDDLINEYRILQYNVIKDKKHTVKDFFSLK